MSVMFIMLTSIILKQCLAKYNIQESVKSYFSVGEVSYTCDCLYKSDTNQFFYNFRYNLEITIFVVE